MSLSLCCRLGCLTLLLISVSGKVAGAFAPTALQRLALKQSDMPRGFRPGVHRTIDNRLDAVREGIKAAQLARHGRLGGYESSFGRYVTPGNGFVVDSVVTAFTAASGAHWYFRSLVRRAVHTGSATTPVGERFGNEAAAAAVGTIAYTVIFRRGRYVATVTEASTSIKLKVPAATVRRYARVVDQRIQVHG